MSDPGVPGPRRSGSPRPATPDEPDDATILSGRRAPEPQSDPDDRTVLSGRRAPEPQSDPDDATILSGRRAPELPAEPDDRTVLSPRRAPEPGIDDRTAPVVARHPARSSHPVRPSPAALPDDLDATSIAAGRPAAAEPFPGTSASPHTHSAGGTTMEDRTEETVLRSVRRATSSGPPADPDGAEGARRSAYLPGAADPDRRAPRASGAVMANRMPVAPPPSVAPAPPPDAVAARRRRERRRVLITVIVVAVVLAAAVAGLVLLLI